MGRRNRRNRKTGEQRESGVGGSEVGDVIGCPRKKGFLGKENLNVIGGN